MRICPTISKRGSPRAPLHGVRAVCFGVLPIRGAYGSRRPLACGSCLPPPRSVLASKELQPIVIISSARSSSWCPSLRWQKSLARPDFSIFCLVYGYWSRLGFYPVQPHCRNGTARCNGYVLAHRRSRFRAYGARDGRPLSDCPKSNLLLHARRRIGNRTEHPLSPGSSYPYGSRLSSILIIRLRAVVPMSSTIRSAPSTRL